MNLEDAKIRNSEIVGKRQKEFDMQLDNLINRLNKRHQHMSSADYRNMASDIQLFSMVFTEISEELRLQESVNRVLSDLE